MASKLYRNLTIIGWVTYLVGVALFIGRWKLDTYQALDHFFLIDLVFFIGLGLSAIIIYSMTIIDMRDFTKAYGGFICPAFLLLVVLSMFLVIPINSVNVVQRDRSDGTLVRNSAYWINPFLDNVYHYNSYAYVVCDSVSIKCEFVGDQLELHRRFTGNTDGFKEYATPIIKEIVNRSTVLLAGQPRINQIYYLFHELPKELPEDIVFLATCTLLRGYHSDRPLSFL